MEEGGQEKLTVSLGTRRGMGAEEDRNQHPIWYAERAKAHSEREGEEDTYLPVTDDEEDGAWPNWTAFN